MRSACPYALFALSVLLSSPLSAPPARADGTFVWIIPDGTEAWTAGLSHSIAWVGGDPIVGGIGLEAMVPPFSTYIVSSGFVNFGWYTWSIPADLPPGTYRLRLGFPGDVVEISPVFTILAAPECLSECGPVIVSTPPADLVLHTPPTVACGESAVAAVAAAEAWALAELDAGCFAGYAIEPGSVILETGFVPPAFCLPATSGVYHAEVTAFGCCCPAAVDAPAPDASWGSVRAAYR